MQEDHVSMGWEAARKLRRAVDNLRNIVVVELTVAARALDLRAPLQPAEGTAAGRDAVRALVPGFGPDREVAPELALVAAAAADGSLLRAVESATGALA
jgi:histidine ammonia-lyase